MDNLTIIEVSIYFGVVVFSLLFLRSILSVKGKFSYKSKDKEVLLSVDVNKK